jgi:hypothetical protein
MSGKRGQGCRICTHREAQAINLAIARGVSPTALARRYNVSTDSIYRHRAGHLPPQLRAALVAGPELSIDLDKLRETESQSLLANLIALRQRLFAALDTAEEYHDAAMLTRVSAQLHHNLELVARLVGDLNVGTTITNNVLVMPQYLELRSALVAALAPFSDAKVAVAQVLHQLEHKAAETIAATPKEYAS